jgi:hypothetical protein
MARYISSVQTMVGLTSTTRGNSLFASDITFTSLSTETLSENIRSLFEEYLLFSITLNNNQYIHNQLLNGLETLFTSLNIQKNDIIYDHSSSVSSLDLSENIVYQSTIRLACKFFNPDLSSSYEHTQNPGVDIDRIAGNPAEPERSIYGNMFDYSGNITSVTLFTAVNTFMNNIRTSGTNIAIKDLSSVVVKTEVETLMSSLDFIQYSADPTDRLYDNKVKSFIHVYLKEIGIPEVDGREYSDEYRAALVGCDTTFRADNSGGTTITLDYGKDFIENFETEIITVSGYLDAYEDLSAYQDDYLENISQIRSSELNTEVREGLSNYIETQYSGILPSSFALRERFTDPIRFKILFRTPLTEEQYLKEFNWGIGYHLGFPKLDTDYNIIHRGIYQPRALGEEYIYLVVNDFENKYFNVYSLAKYEANAQRYEFQTPQDTIISNTDSSDNQIFKLRPQPNTTTVDRNPNVARGIDMNFLGGHNKYYTKIQLPGFFSYAYASGPTLSFDPPLPSLDKIRLRLVDRYGNTISNTACDYTGTVRIQTKSGIIE